MKRDQADFDEHLHPGNGNAIELMRRALGANTFDMSPPYKQRLAWQREATQLLTNGHVRSGLELYRRNGAIHEYATQREAYQAIVMRWREIEESGIECSIEAFVNRDRRAINALARHQWRLMSRLRGKDHVLETIDYKTPYAVGDRIVVRQHIPEAGLSDGCVAIVEQVSVGALMVRRRDGAVVRIDTLDHQGVQHAYCSTEHVDHGATNYAVLQLASEQVYRRPLTLEMTRHTHGYEIFYSLEAINTFDALVELAERTLSAHLASDFDIV